MNQKTNASQPEIYKLDAKHVAVYMLLGLGFATVMGFMYMQYVYYDAMIETLKISNAQLGFLISILGVTGLVTCIPGGLIADRVDCRKALSISLFIMMLFCGLFAVFPNYNVAQATWLCAGAVMSVWYSAIYKTIRVIAPPQAIGKSFGLFGAGVAIGSIVVNVAGLQLYDAFAVVSLETGLSAILWAFFIAGMISSIGGYFLVMRCDIQESVAIDKNEAGKFSFMEMVKDLVRIAKDPGTWLYVFGCFCIYSFQVSISYFTPYFTAVIGTTVALSGIVAIFRQYGLRIISAPIGGVLGDKLGGTAKVIRASFCVLIVLVAAVMLLPEGTPFAVLLAIVMILGLLGTMNISLQASISGDALVPPQNMGLIVALTSLFSADLFQETLFGYWLDSFGTGGYTYIWIYTICVLVAGIVLMTIMINRKKRMLAKKAGMDEGDASK